MSPFRHGNKRKISLITEKGKKLEAYARFDWNYALLYTIPGTYKTCARRIVTT